MSKFIVVAVDIGETVDGHSSFLGIFDSWDDAHKFVKEDMKDVVHSGGGNLIIDEQALEIWTDETKTEGCVWDIFEIGGGM